MKALVYHGQGQRTWEDKPRPTVQDPGDAIVRITTSTICGTDQRLREGTDPTRVYAVLGLQGLSPYRFEVEPTLFVSHKGQVSGRLTATYDVLLSQRLILQPRLETNVAVQRDEEIGIGAGLNDAELGVRLRYEVRREFAPYVGVTWKESFGDTHRLTTQGGGDPSHFVVVAGARAWF